MQQSAEPRVRVRLDIAYDGTAFSGWARQPGLRTVQGTLEEALATVFRRWGDAPRLTVAGRTDAGVHAAGQVAHLDLGEQQLAHLTARDRPGTSRTPADALARKLNGIAGLTSDVYVRSARLAPRGFDARFSAVWRRYRYRIADTEAVRDPIRRHDTVWHPSRLDDALMDDVARRLLGLHDWAAYCRPREGSTTIRELQDFGWVRDADGVLVASLRADAFCHSMVRNLVGASVAVGEGRLAPDRMPALRDAAERSSEFVVMPARGLTLVEVGYPADELLAARAEQTRARRDDE